MARTNPFRFSTKYQDDETDQLYYGHRYYDASTGRWMSRDPIGELSSPALYALVSNDSLIHWDYLGLEVGTVRVIRNEPLVSVIGFGWQLELEWVPPVEWNDIRNNCIPCRRAVWVQDYKYDIDLIWPWTDTHTDWVRDWDENDYSGSAYEWIAGARSSKTSAL